MVKTWLNKRKERVKWIVEWSRKLWLWGFYKTRTEAFVKCMLNYWSWS